MKLVILKNNESKDLLEFIVSWSRFYSFANEEVYKRSIAKKVFTPKDIQKLYEWKNGMKLSGGKQKSLDSNIKAKIQVLNTLKLSPDFDIEIFKKEFKGLSAVWKIFLLHIIKPCLYPIYDQHIHRTFLFIHDRDWSNISNTSINNKTKEEFYFKEYLPFIQSNNIKDLKKLDEAFFAFGQFLKTRNYKTLFTQ